MSDGTPRSVHGRSLDRHDLLARIGTFDQVAGVRLVTLGDGGGRGVRLLQFRSGGGLEFEVVVDRAFDIGHASIDARPLAWTSPVGVESPWLREPTEMGWLRGFGGGLLATGGLDHTLFPDTDDASHLAYPAKQTESYPLHGRLSGEPAKLTGYGRVDRGSDQVLWAEGCVRQAAVFGEVLELRRRIECVVGTNELSITDQVTNHAYQPSPHMILYHVNLGFPLIDDGSRLDVEFESAEPRGDFDLDGFDRFGAPVPGFVEQVVELRPRPDATGTATATVSNATRDLAVYERYRCDELPYLFVWRMLGRGTYVVGLEPSSNSTAGRHEARRRGELRVLRPGETIEYEVTIGALSGDAVTVHLDHNHPGWQHGSDHDA